MNGHTDEVLQALETTLHGRTVATNTDLRYLKSLIETYMGERDDNYLKDAMGKYKNLQNTYYAKKLPAPIKNMFHEESREIPKNVGEELSRNSVAINRLHTDNSLGHELVKKSELNKKSLKRLKNLGIASAGVGALSGLSSVPSKINALIAKP